MKKRKGLVGLILLLCFFGVTEVRAQDNQIRAYLDLQMHPTMSFPYPFFSKGFKFYKEGKAPNLKFKHQLKNVNYANYYIENKGVDILVTGVLNREGINKKKKARKRILNQIKYIENFAKENAAHFVVAKSPEAVRELVETTNKTIILLSIEGGRGLINSQEDAFFWAQQGITFITLVHLVDAEYGAAAIKPGLMTKLINWRGTIKKEKKRKGLTEAGKNAIRWLANAGVMIDLTHMADKTRIDALDFMEAAGIPPIVTHDFFRPIQNQARGLSEEQIIQIYKNGGFIGLPISGMALKAYHADPEYATEIDSLKQAGCFCEGSIDSYKYTYLKVKDLIESNHQQISGRELDAEAFDELTEAQKVQYSIGFQSDFNGWVNHSMPRYGKKGCYPIQEGKPYEEIETEGMATPDLLASQWRLLEKEGVDLAPIQRNAERFLQLWTYFKTRAASHNQESTSPK